MRLIKMLGLATVAALTAMALTGVGSASAGQIDKCLLPAGHMPTNPGQAECEKLGTIDTVISLLLHAEKPELTGFLKQVCDKSLALVNAVGDAEGAKITVPKEENGMKGLTFEGNCKPCSTVTVNGLPYTGRLSMSGSNYTATIPGEATLSGCPLGVTCTFKTTGAGATLDLELTPPEYAKNSYNAVNEELKLVSGSKAFCGETGTWTAKYVSLDPWYLFLLP